MSESSKQIRGVSIVRSPKRPWGIVLAGGRAVRLRHAKRCANRPNGRANASGDFRGEILERHRDTQWH
jgi:hypothetical protein